ncbi:exonuclease domain-containing protein [Mesorhizobium sp. L2C084A000]|uniref:exonuclease domain-containing protein n=1 Tax=Mesorhizobium sp. L2C084A000 TaxID=1287116 RepID=UPI0018CA3CBB|nr:exonuclease domain-containing protein [Mesorhizobium sp. L2C084A000]
MPFIFYDTETTGADRSFDQILQFAAALTDDDLNVIDSFEIRCRLLPHTVPSPDAMVVTGVRVDQLFDLQIPSHHKMCGRIHEVLTAWSPAPTVAYNSVSCDEELLRRAFCSSLLPIYLINARAIRDWASCHLRLPHTRSRPEASTSLSITKAGQGSERMHTAD